MFRKESPLVEDLISFTDCPKSRLQFAISQAENGNEVIAWPVSVLQWQSDLDSIMGFLDSAELELSDCKKKFSDLEKEKEILYTEMLEELDKTRKTYQDEDNLVMKENEETRKHIRRLESETRLFKCVELKIES